MYVFFVMQRGHARSTRTDTRVPATTLFRAVHDPQVRHRAIEVLAASDGDQAVALFAQHQPRYVVVDVQLGGQSGLEVCSRLRSLAGGGAATLDRKSTRLNSSHSCATRMPSSA